VFHLMSCIPQSEMAVLAGDMNGHVGSSNVGYDKMHASSGYGDADGSRIHDLRVCRWAKGSHLQHFVGDMSPYWLYFGVWHCRHRCQLL